MNTEWKNFTVEDYKVIEENGNYYVTGYANTKNHEDSYGDIPTSYNGRPVYDLESRFSKNPVALVDHVNSVSNIFGSFVLGPGATEEDSRGLKIKLLLANNAQTESARHAVAMYKEGHARAFSIGGEWRFEDPNNPNHLTRAIIHEISGVAIGADSNALTNAQLPKKLTEVAEATRKQIVIEELVEKYRKTNDLSILAAIEKLK